MIICGIVMAGSETKPEMVIKTYTGRLLLIDKEVNGRNVSRYYVVNDKKKRRLPKVNANMNLRQYLNKEVTVVVKGVNKQVKSKEGKIKIKFYSKKIITIAEVKDEE